VLMLERGRNIEHVKDYVHAMKAAWDFPHRNRPTQARKAAFPVLMRDSGLAENLDGMWANEQESPYIET
ncbi:GMC family oxidoreductase, partial [Stenotrophomonas maltophilia]